MIDFRSLLGYGNPHYIGRYVRFIESCSSQKSWDEEHHILPKAIFPEYKDFEAFPWNCAKLTFRQHYLAHWMLAKAFGKSQATAFWLMNNHPSYAGIKSARVYESSKLAHNAYIKTIKYVGGNHTSKHSEESKRKISTSMKGNKNYKKGLTFECPYCKIASKSMVIYRYHFDKCKMKPVAEATAPTS